MLLWASGVALIVYMYKEEMEVSSSIYSHARSPQIYSPSCVFSTSLLPLVKRARAISSAQHYLHLLLLAIVFPPLLDKVPKLNDKPRSHPFPKVQKEISSL